MKNSINLEKLENSDLETLERGVSEISQEIKRRAFKIYESCIDTNPSRAEYASERYDFWSHVLRVLLDRPDIKKYLE